MSLSLLLIALLAGLVMIGVIAFVFMRANNVNLTNAGDEKPEWMRETPPRETIEATLSENEGIQVFNHDPGEKLAAPFAEQIEDIVRVRLKANPELSHYEIDLGTAEDSGLEIWVNGEKFSSIEDLPDQKLRQVFQESVEAWKSQN